MFNTYLKIAVRNLQRKKIDSFFNLIGLSIGLSAGILIFQYIAYEKSFDTFNSNHRQIYRVALNSYQAGELTEQSATSFPALGPSAKQAFPEITDYARLFKQAGVIKFGENLFREENGYLADASAVNVFSIKMIQGDKDALKNPRSILVSEALSRKYFGNVPALYRTIEFENEPYIVRGIYEDYPPNAHLKIDYLLSYPDSGLIQQSWRWRNIYTYLVTRPDTDIAALQQNLNRLLAINNKSFYQKESRKDEVFLQQLTSIHLHSHLDKEIDANGSAAGLTFLFIVGVLVLVMSWANYINLTVANAGTRHKEIGVRKILGSSKTQLVHQFFVEALLLNLIAFGLAISVITFSGPWFKEISGISSLGIPVKTIVLLYISILLTGLLLTGLYPSIIISRAGSVNLIKGMSSFTRSFPFRGALMVLQFFITTGLITGVLVIYRQLNYMTSKNPEFITRQILIVRGSGDSDSPQSSQSFVNELSNAPFIQGVSKSAFVPGQEITRIRGIKRKGGLPAYHTFANTTIDDEFVDLYGLKLIAGRNFSKDYPSDNKGVLLNEEAVKVLGFRNASAAINGEIINGDRNPDTLRVVGVLENFHQRSAQFEITPTVFLLGNDNNSFYSMRINTSDISGTISFIAKMQRKYFGDSPFDFFFLDDHFNRQYRKDNQFATLFTLFTAIAISISCLGLFAMIKFVSEQRTKEIGIRKVLGASALNIFSMLTQGLLKPVVVAILIAMPFTWWIMNLWLQNYATRIPLSGDLFIYGGLAAIAITLLTISYQVVKASMVNPTKSLRTD